MTNRINLLPHREERRKRARQHFAVLGVVTAIVGLVIVGLMHGFYAKRIETQADRNTYMKNELSKLDKQIAQIKELRGQIAALLARKQVIETLQADRAQTVHLLEELVRQMPEGVYLKTMHQKGLTVSVVGYAQSNARVSTLMRNIEASPWLQSPHLIEIKAASVGSRRVSEFSMTFALKRPTMEEPKNGKSGKPGAKKKG